MAQTDVEYPDTGYPALHQPQPPLESRAEGNLPNAYDAPASRQNSSGYQVTTREENRPEPQRGFYGDKYGTSDSGSVVATDASSAADRYAGADSGSSRYSDPGTDRGYSRYGKGEDLPAPNQNLPAANASPLVSDADTGYEPYGGQTYDRSPDQRAMQSYSSDLNVDDRDAQGLADTSRQVTEDLREDYQRTTNELRGRLEQGASSLSGSVQGIAREAGQQLERGAAEVGRSVRDGYSRFSSNFSDEPNGTVATEATQGGRDDRVPELDNSQTPSSSSLSGPAGSQQDSSFNAAAEMRSGPTTNPSRTRQPWRPGSTNSYPGDAVDQTQYPSSTYGDVEPASYPATADDSERRFAPSYR